MAVWRAGNWIWTRSAGPKPEGTLALGKEMGELSEGPEQKSDTN